MSHYKIRWGGSSVTLMTTTTTPLPSSLMAAKKMLKYHGVPSGSVNGKTSNQWINASEISVQMRKLWTKFPKHINPQ